MGSKAPPKVASYNEKGYYAVTEGEAEILTPAPKDFDSVSSKIQSGQEVFYNPVQQFNRDLSVLAIRAFAQDFEYEREAKRRKFGDQREGRAQGRGKKRKREEGPNGVKARANRDSSLKANEDEEEPKQQQQQRHERPSPPIRILDALSATGLRAIRYAKELPVKTHVTANDLSAPAITAIKRNVEHNGLLGNIQTSTSDAIAHMNHAHSSSGDGPGTIPYHVVDLDPYGTATPFLDAAVRAVADGGLLCVTCTDSAIFASTGYLEKTFSQYGGLPLKGPQAHEGGLRLILHAIATAAARYGISIEPLLSLSIDFYARVFVRIHKSPAQLKMLASKAMVVYNCDAGCGAWSIQRIAHAKGSPNRNGEIVYKHTAAIGSSAGLECEHCGFKTHIVGPMWGGPLHNPYFIQRILEMLPSLDSKVYGTIPRIEGMLSTALQEDLDLENLEKHAAAPAKKADQDMAAFSAESVTASTSTGAETPSVRPVPPIDPAYRTTHPFFIVLTNLAAVIHCETPSEAAFRGALSHLGYRSSRSHTKAGSIVTDASWNVIWEIMREWVRQKAPIREGAVKDGTAGKGIMSHDRSNASLNDARETFKRASKSQDERTIRVEIEALLQRMGGKPPQDLEGVEQRAVAEGTSPPQDEAWRAKASPVQLSKLKINFDEVQGKKAMGKKMMRYQMNPLPDWGPMTKAKAISNDTDH
ncbi:MAG: RNA methyltransferase tRNA(m5U54)methyltransferase [Ramalina farinacea]|uniref:tRNA (guanine(26)-N(2))-dimethyltransferase n=1 Tax=Ramalina farinacea TaxID=258253 RepID=A0AA43QGH1_9LECA|nr:RNA methyltransferase tRNA(m5U54)methyltransferase [Ramalina farinacea]